MALLRISKTLDLDPQERLPLILLLLLFGMLCIAGGASREDVLSQAVIRATAVLLMVVQLVAGRLPQFGRYKACVLLLGGMALVAALQLIPLPPAVWSALPGRGFLATSPSTMQIWRPINLVPDAGWSALFSLLVPLCVLVLVSVLEGATVRRVRYLLLVAVLVSSVIAALQATGSAPDNNLINASDYDYPGIFANRNHQALFLAIGIAIAWFWGFEHGGSLRDRRLWLAIGVVFLLFISILVTGSRSGAVLGALAIVATPVLAKRRGKAHRANQMASIALWVVIGLALIASVVLVSAYLGRAQSLSRASELDAGADFRLVALPTVLETARTYFPIGAGLGSFDAVFRMAEPFRLLKPTYFNHAHNDLIETIIETGVAGPAIFLLAMIWAARRTILSIMGDDQEARIGRLGALVVLLIVMGSLSDYPARTPMIMATLMISGAWLTGRPSRREAKRIFQPLPANGNPL